MQIRSPNKRKAIQGHLMVYNNNKVYKKITIKL